MNAAIQIISAREVDPEKWNHCIGSHSHGLIYSRKEYLDELCDHWQALILQDYKAILPLPWRRKYGVRYAYIPSFVQQTGITGTASEAERQALFTQVHRFVQYGDIHLNFSHHPQPDFPVTARTNFVIDLSPSIEQVRRAYRNDLRENIRKAAANELQYSKALPAEAILHFREQYAPRFEKMHTEDFERFNKLCELYQQTGKCLARKVSTPTGIVLATAVLLKDERRIYHLMNTTLPEGRALAANHFLIDQVLAEFAGTAFCFDMEGSERPGVKQFYAGFGPVNQPYFHYHFNRLPWPLRLLKR